MIDPFDTKNRHLTDRLARTRLRTFWSVTLERATDCSWRLLTWVGLFAGLWLFQLPPLFGYSGEILALLIFLIGSGYFIFKDVRQIRFPSRLEIDRRIEHESKLKHRPLTAYDDALANPFKSNTRVLWHDGRARVVEALRKIRSGKPKAFMATRDPQALRLGVLLFLLVGVFIAGPAWNERIFHGLTPLRFDHAGESADKLSLWITPPQYTAIAPYVVKGRSDDIIDIPDGSTLKFNVRGGAFLPRLVIGKTKLPFKETDDGNYLLETKAPAGQVLKITQGFFPRASWNYKIIPDLPPEITMNGAAEITSDGTMRFPLEMIDDYGVKNLTMAVALNQSMPPGTLGAPTSDTRIVMSPPKIKLPMQPVYDLTAHPWAGLPVSIVFTAEDGLGHRAMTKSILLNLPERDFKHPVARRIIALRKTLIMHPTDNYQAIAEQLEDIMIRPGLYLDDKVIFLSLRAAASRLFWADPASKAVAESTIALLWDIALRIEGGEVSIAARNLREKQRNLENALQNPETSPEDIQKMMAELRSAMSEYFVELQRELQKRMAQGQDMSSVPPEMMAKNIDPEALSNFFEQLEARIAAGDKNAAQEMLGQLQRLMDMMDPSMAGPMPEDMQMMSEGINKLQELIKKQKELLEQTESQLRSVSALLGTEQKFGEQLKDDEKIPEDWHMDDMPPPPEAPKENLSVVLDTTPHKAEQEALRQTLGQIMMDAGEALQEVPANMGAAELEMRGSGEALGENDPAASIPHQEKAIENLQQAQKQLSEQFSQRMQQMTGLSMMGGGMKFDPLGRAYGKDGAQNGLFGSPVKIPDESERKKAQEILKLIRKRSSELERPDDELDYYKRLLKQF